MSNVLASEDPGNRPCRSAFRILTRRGAAECRTAERERLKLQWEPIHAKIAEGQLRPATMSQDQLRDQFVRLCERTARSIVRLRRLALAMRCIGALIVAPATSAIILTALWMGRPTVALAAAVTVVALSAPAYLLLRRQQTALTVALTLTAVALTFSGAWTASGGFLPSVPALVGTALVSEDHDALLGLALGSALVGAVLVVALVLLAIETSVQRRMHRVSEPDVRAFEGLVETVQIFLRSSLPSDPDRRRIARHLTSAVRSIENFHRLHPQGSGHSFGDRWRTRRELRRIAAGLREHSRQIFATQRRDTETIHVCLRFLVSICTNRYGDMPGAGEPVAADPPRGGPSIRARLALAGPAVPVAMVTTHLLNIRLTTPNGILFLLAFLLAFAFAPAVLNGPQATPPQAAGEQEGGPDATST